MRKCDRFTTAIVGPLLVAPLAAAVLEIPASAIVWYLAGCLVTATHSALCTERSRTKVAAGSARSGATRPILSRKSAQPAAETIPSTLSGVEVSNHQAVSDPLTVVPRLRFATSRNRPKRRVPGQRLAFHL